MAQRATNVWTSPASKILTNLPWTFKIRLISQTGTIPSHQSVRWHVTIVLQYPKSNLRKDHAKICIRHSTHYSLRNSLARTHRVASKSLHELQWLYKIYLCKDNYPNLADQFNLRLSYRDKIFWRHSLFWTWRLTNLRAYKWAKPLLCQSQTQLLYSLKKSSNNPNSLTTTPSYWEFNRCLISLTAIP